MIKRIIYGQPIETLAVVEDVQSSQQEEFFCSNEKDDGIEFIYNLSKNDYVYGLGETMGGVNKRGRRFVSFNSDNNNHTNDTESLYGSHNFLVIDGKEHFGVFFDTPSKVIFEIDLNNSGIIRVFCENKNLTMYEITGTSAYDITKQFLKIIGKSFAPPIWAFGLGQSKWGYTCEEDFKNVIENYQKNNLPLDYICMDIDYMDRYIDFTIDKTRFPNMKEFISYAKQKGVHLVPIIDAGIKIEPGNSVYEEGVKNNYFCKDKNGDNFKALVWPGLTHFTDFFQPKARKWFGSQYKFLTDLGFEGFWNDMNEPSIFAVEFDKDNKNNKTERDLKALEEKQKVEDYKMFYHNINGKMINHYDVHNIYGHLMTVAAGEELGKLIKNRYLLFTRSTYIGSHRYGGLWTGDNFSQWDHLKQNVLQMPSLNMCGFLYSGADTGGFGKNCSRELLLRWLAFSTFTPLMRIHSDRKSTPQECYSFGATDDFKCILSLRYKLLPYIYSEYMKALLTSDMYIKPLAFEFSDDEKARSIEDQLLVGDSIMIAPFIEEGKISRKVYLPENMTKVKYDGKDFECEYLNQGEYEIESNLNDVVFFIRDKKLIPISNGDQSTKEIDLSQVILLGNGEKYEQYVDDGQTKDVSLENVRTIYKEN